MVETPPKNRSAQNLIKRIAKSEVEFDYLMCKANAEITMDGERKSFKSNIRIKQDSVIWISITPAFGVELLRLMITKDSVKFINKWDKQYFIGDYSSMTNYLGTEVNFDMLQNALIGNAISFDPELKWKSSIDGMRNQLSSKTKRRVKKAVGVKDVQEVAQNLDSLDIENQRKYDRVIRRMDEEKLLLSRYWIHPNTFKITRTNFTDLHAGIMVNIAHEDYIEVEEQQYFPGKTTFKVQDNLGTKSFDIEFSRFKLKSELSFSFNIPKEFERIVK